MCETKRNGATGVTSVQQPPPHQQLPQRPADEDDVWVKPATHSAVLYTTATAHIVSPSGAAVSTTTSTKTKAVEAPSPLHKLSATLPINENLIVESLRMAPGQDPVENNISNKSNLHADKKSDPHTATCALAESAREEDTSNNTMGACYPKCMNHDFDDGRILPGMRARRPERRSTASAKVSSTDSYNYDCNYGFECVDLEQIGGGYASSSAMRMNTTLDLEELALEGGDSDDGFEHPPKSIVVDYEEAHDDVAATAADGVSSRRQSKNNNNGKTVECAPDACAPMEKFLYLQNPADELFELDTLTSSVSTPLTPGRRRSSRKSSIGNSKDNNSSELTTPRRGKSIIFKNDQIVEKPMVASKEPISPSTQTEISEDSELRCSRVPKLCLCEVKLHKTKASCWLVANNEVYDVTGIMDVHPGGVRSILRKAGGPDCTQDMKFHTKKARKMLEKCFIGKLQPCGEDDDANTAGNCSIM
ncbi:Nitrate reductase, partial [Globisporangium splendens]